MPDDHPPDGHPSVAGSPDDQEVTLTAATSDDGTLPQTDPTSESSVVELLRACGADAGRYVEQGVIAQGGMGEIALCVERNTRRQVAMKRMLPSTAVDPSRRARFVEEAQVTAQLEHPNIVPVHELDRAPDGSIYFTMKLVKGRSLAEILKAMKEGEQDVSLGDLLQVFLKVCDGVAFAHSKGVIHRDLKPANIMVGDYGEVLVMDWGLAKIVGREDIRAGDLVTSSRLESTPELTLDGTAMGTPAYMPPEQANGEIEKIDHRSDIYSLGGILYEMLTLEKPVAGETPMVVLAKAAHGKIEPPEQRAPSRNVPRELSAVAMKCLSKLRSRRYQSVLDLKRDISLFLEGRSVTAAPDTFGQALVKLVKRNKGISASVAAAAVVLLAVSTVFVVRLKAERDQARANERRAVEKEQEALVAQREQRETALASAKRFAMQAIRAAETGRMAEAERRVKDAELVAENSPWGPYARGMFARNENDFGSAARFFRQALEADPAHAESKAALSEVLAKMGTVEEATRLAEQVGSITDWRSLLKIGETLYEADRWQDCQVPFRRAIELMEKEQDASVQHRAETAKEVQAKIAEAQWTLDAAGAKAACVGFAESLAKLPPEEQIKAVEAKLSEANGSPIGLNEHETKIRNGEVVTLTFVWQSQAVRFIDPLNGLPLRELRLGNSAIRDLDVLRGMPLERLHVSGGNVADLSPLAGMALRHLACGETRVEDLTPLRGMPVTYLDIGGTRVADLTPLKGMSLTYLECSHTQVTDLSILKGMPLKHLGVKNCKIRDISPLKGMPLEHLDTGGLLIADLSPLKGAPLKWLAPPDRFTDLRQLKGMKLEWLYMPRKAVTDLSPLAGMPLRYLCCHYSPVASVEPLRGMPLERLDIGGTKVTDLTPLIGMKLKEFYPPPIEQLTERSRKLIEELTRQGCKIRSWED